MPLSGLTEQQHEALCRRCGSSCHWAVPVNGLPVIVDGLHCKFLAKESPTRFRCTVYERRFEAAPWCQTAEQSLEHGLLAQDCPYTKYKQGYRGKVRLHPRMMNVVEPKIREHLLAIGAPMGVWEEGVLAFLHRTGEEKFMLVLDASGERHQVVPALATESAEPSVPKNEKPTEARK